MALENGGNGLPKVPAAAPGVELVAFIVGLDEIGGAVALEVAGKKQGRKFGTGMVLRVQADVAHDVIHAAVAVEVSRGNEAAAAGALKLIIPKIKNGADRRLPLDQRVGLAVLLARNKQTELAREETRTCIDQLNEAELRSLSTGSLYRLLVLIRGFGLRIDQPAMLDLTRDLLPPERDHNDRAHTP